jgi:hypothetical protein
MRHDGVEERDSDVVQRDVEPALQGPQMIRLELEPKVFPTQRDSGAG